MKPEIERFAVLRSDVAFVGAIALLPLAGAWMTGSDLRGLTEFPPRLAVPMNYPRWSSAAAAMVVLTVATIVASLGWAFLRASPGPRTTAREFPPAQFRFPMWGWAAMLWTVGWWALAWSRNAWFAPFQRYTFFPLWLGFIVTVNALATRRAGTCFMLRSPQRWLGLFGVSALFWWLFEWLNRFVRNWHYLGIEDFGPLAYAVHATACFSTVLPAVLAVRECIGSHDTFRRFTVTGPAWLWLNTRLAGIALFVAGLAGLCLTGARPQEFYPALWLAPLLLAFGRGIIGRHPGIWRDLARGDWRQTAGWAIAALVCGWFWEMWNWLSLAKWTYTVPYVERWHVFEMPLLGYAGYLGFGIECALVVERVLGSGSAAGDDGRRAPHVTAG